MLAANQRDVLEASRRRVWALCYRLTGDRAAADDLAQESMARAIERAADVRRPDGFEGWLYRVATTTCLDWLRRHRRDGARIRLVDPVDLEGVSCAEAHGPEDALLRREDIRLGVLSTLQRLPPRQRAVLVLRDVADRSVEETARVLGITPANVKVMLHRARRTLAREHRVTDGDVPADPAVVERFARAIERADVAALVALLAPDVWGIVDDGGGRRRPSVGLRAVARQWQNALRRYGLPDRVVVATLNGERAIVVAFAGEPFATVHLETGASRVRSIRVVRDPTRLSHLRHLLAP